MTVTRLLLAVLFTGTVNATTLFVSVRSADGHALPARASITAASITDRGLGSERSFSLRGDATSFELKAADGAVWDLSVRAPGFWSAKQAVALTDKPLQLRFTVYRTARVHGTIVLPKDSPKVAVLAVGFRTTATPSVSGESECPVVENAWSCDIPGLVSDLRLKSRGYMAHYRWDVKLEPGGDKDLGPLVFRRGASVVGHVEIDDRKEPLSAVVLLQPQPTTHANYAKDTAMQALAFTAKVNSKGFFSFDGVAPGAYIISAKQKNFATEPREVRVIADTEAELAKPLRLVRPQGVLVTVSPPADVKMRPWRLFLRPLEARIVPAEAPVDTRGSHEFRGVPSGKYLLTVLASDGTAWAAQQLDVTPATPPVYIDIKPLHVNGHLSLGDRPLSGKIWFGGEHGAVSVALQSHSDGTFEGDLPRDGSWPVQVAADQPKVQRKLTVAVRRPESGRAAEVAIKLPATSLSGTTVSEQGVAVSGALVNAATDDGLVQESSGADGSFHFEGLSAGSLRLTAAASGTLVSNPVDVVLNESHPTDDVRLVLRDAAVLRGRVIFQTGGVPGAVVYGYSTADPSPSMVPSSCNEAGEFRVRLSPGTTEAALIVGAQGFALRAVRVPVGKGPVAVEVDQNGGRLELAYAERTLPFVLRDGIIIPFPILASWARGNGGSVTSTHLVTQNVAAGDYVICPGGDASSSKCKRGTLAPLGQLRLDAGE